MPVDEPRQKRQNWYKIATILLSVITVTISFVSGIYYKRTGERQQKLDRIDQKIEKLILQKEKLLRVPKVEVLLQTLEKSGLPENAFQTLGEIPAVVQIRHAGGETARGITVEIMSNADILKFTPDPSVEQFTYSVDPSKKKTRIEIPQLRANSCVQGTITTNRITPLTFQTSIDQGSLMQRKGEELKWIDKIMPYEEMEKLNPTSVTSIDEINRLVDKLRVIQKQERDRSVFDSAPAGLNVLLSGIAPILIIVLFFFQREYIRGKKGHRLGNRIGRSKMDGSLKLGMSGSEVKQILGEPQRISTREVGSGPKERWEYTPRASLFYGWQPDAFITLREGKIVQVEYKEYGHRDYRT